MNEEGKNTFKKFCSKKSVVSCLNEKKSSVSLIFFHKKINFALIYAVTGSALELNILLSLAAALAAAAAAAALDPAASELLSSDDVSAEDALAASSSSFPLGSDCTDHDVE